MHTVVYTKASELITIDKVHEAGVRSRGDALVELSVVSNWVTRAVEHSSVDVRRVGNVE